MSNLRRNFERLCLRNRDKGIPSLMLWISIITMAVCLINYMDPSNTLFRALAFNRGLILEGQVWRLITYIFLPTSTSAFVILIMLFFYCQVGRAIESSWGRFKFNLFYLCGIVVTDIACMLIPGCAARVYWLHLSLILAFATLYPENQVLLFFIIPLRMKYLAWFYFAYTIYYLVAAPFPGNLLPLFALVNYLLFFGRDIRNVFTSNSGHRSVNFNVKNAFQRQSQKRPKAKTVRYKSTGAAGSSANWADQYRSASGQKPYHHKCTVCGRTDTDYPDLEFRYCSRCSGYHCYCIDHINNHTHIVSDQ